MAFNKAPIKRYAEERSQSWYYSICATQPNTNANVLVGFNWGAAKDYKYEAQKEMPRENFRDLYDTNDLGSLQRIYQPLVERLGEQEAEQCVQTNFCFFRSKTEGQISNEDLALSKPLFNRLMEMLRPERIIGFSSQLRDHFLYQVPEASLDMKEFASNTRTIYVAKGAYHAGDRKIPVCFLPHPNAKFTSEARWKAWDYGLR